jgi:single-stranded-DNA-specific exonuclease
MGLLSSGEARLWLEPRLSHLPLPDELPDLEDAVRRIDHAIRNREVIAVYGDYDVDGLTATFLLSDFLSRSGAQVVSYIPHRLLSGYGLHNEGIHKLKRQNVSLIITVDCGVSNHGEIEEANRLGIDVIVTDHHLLPDLLPPALAVVNPKRLSPEHALSPLAGVGVAFYLAVALRRRLRESGCYRAKEEPNLREYMDLIALGTVADLMPLQGVNRILVRHGLHELSHGSRIAIEALRQVVGQRGARVTPWDIHFRYAPRINAASRLGRQEVIMSWLSSRLIEDASSLALQMEQMNRERATLEGDVFQDAVLQIDQDASLQSAKALVLAQRGWHAGILGIVASRVVERYKKPAILLTWKGEHWEGSGRSIAGFHLHKALQHCARRLERFGGHAMAVGLKVAEESLTDFRRELAEYAEEQLKADCLDTRLSIQAPLPLSDINEGTIAWLERMEPFGQGCPEPVFWAESVNVYRQEVLQEQHLRLVLGQNGKRFPAIAFRMAPLLTQPVNRLHACMFVPMRKVWGGQSTIQLRVLDFVK